MFEKRIRIGQTIVRIPSGVHLRPLDISIVSQIDSQITLSLQPSLRSDLSVLLITGALKTAGRDLGRALKNKK
jgi:hypothetical protein